MQPIADCECCGTPLYEGDDFTFCPEGIIWTCRSCVEDGEERLREEFGWIGVGRGEVTDRGGPPEFPDREVGCDEPEGDPPF